MSKWVIGGRNHERTDVHSQDPLAIECIWKPVRRSEIPSLRTVMSIDPEVVYGIVVV